MLTQSIVKDALRYDPDTGVFTRVNRNQAKTGRITQNGYVQIQVSGVREFAHRLAWIYMTGETPTRVDHINGVKTDNRWVNLRIATSSENGCNRSYTKRNKLQLKNIGFIETTVDGKCYSYYRVQIKKNGVTTSKLFKDLHAAVVWRDVTLKELHGDYSSVGTSGIS